MQLDVHQLQGFLHTQDVACGILGDRPALAHQCTQDLGSVIGQERRGEETAAMELLYLLRIGHVRLLACHVLGVT